MTILYILNLRKYIRILSCIPSSIDSTVQPAYFCPVIFAIQRTIHVKRSLRPDRQGPLFLETRRRRNSPPNTAPLLYVYNEDVLRRRCRELLGLSSLPGFHVNYSAKANTNLALLRIVREEGCHADAMSPGELHINKLAGFTPDRLLYVCNNVSAEEMKNAADNGLIVSVDSLSQLDQYGKVNPGGKVMIRINPGIGAGHHKKVITAGKETKFGIDPTSLDEVRALLKKHSLTLAGVNQHIGSLFMEPDNYLNAIEFLLHFVQSDLADLLPGIEIIDFGGGLGIPYRKYEEEPRLDMAELGRRLHALLSAWVEETGYKGKFFIEPGRYVVAECGVLLGTVHATKFNGENRYVGTDLGFNVLVRPAMYDSFHDIEIFRGGGEPDTDLVEQSIVGNICESGDILAKKRMLPLIKEATSSPRSTQGPTAS